MPIIEDKNPIHVPCTGIINLDKEKSPLSFFTRVCVNPAIISIPITIKKIVIIHFRFSFERVAAYPAPTIAPKIMPIDIGVTIGHSTLFLL